MMLAVKVSIIFWFTWEKWQNHIANVKLVDITRQIRFSLITNLAACTN
jgi:hypothetical protein